MTRTILVHLNVEVADNDRRSPDQIGDFIVETVALGVNQRIRAAKALGKSTAMYETFAVCAPLVDEV